MRKILPLWIVLAFVLAGLVRAQENGEQPPDTSPAGEVIDASDIAKLKENAGKKVTVRGKVSGTFKARTGRILINFEGARRDFVAMITPENADAVNAGFDGDVAKAVDGKTITVSGEVTLYRGNPQIEVTTSEQIRIEQEKS